MEVVIVSNYVLIRKGLEEIISKNSNIHIKKIAENIKSAITIIKNHKIDVIFVDLHQHNEDELSLIKKMKDSGLKSKFIIIDFNNNEELFIKAIKYGIEGYISGECSEDELLHIIEQVHKGKKCFDSCFIGNMIDDNNIKPKAIESLTPREKQILREIGKGMTNNSISEKFYISENTVKKHINHIFCKLNVKDRTKAALYANRLWNYK
ncbi:MAG: response regulator transcription factor [Clostridium sp.]|nr:response regulator transcription factor [Clostridium sp.]